MKIVDNEHCVKSLDEDVRIACKIVAVVIVEANLWASSSVHTSHIYDENVAVDTQHIIDRIRAFMVLYRQKLKNLFRLKVRLDPNISIFSAEMAWRRRHTRWGESFFLLSFSIWNSPPQKLLTTFYVKFNVVVVSSPRWVFISQATLFLGIHNLAHFFSVWNTWKMIWMLKWGRGERKRFSQNSRMKTCGISISDKLSQQHNPEFLMKFIILLKKLFFHPQMLNMPRVCSCVCAFALTEFRECLCEQIRMGRKGRGDGDGNARCHATSLWCWDERLSLSM